MRRRGIDCGPARWHITVASADNTELLFQGAPANQAEAEALAREARRLRPEARIWLHPPAGPVYHWD